MQTEAMLKNVETLAGKAATADNHVAAMQYAQAALNLANAIIGLVSSPAREKNT